MAVLAVSLGGGGGRRVRRETRASHRGNVRVTRQARKLRQVDIGIFGDAELAAKLHELSFTMQKSSMRKALRAGGKILRNAARQRAPRDTGELFKGIKLRALPRSRSIIGVQVVSEAKHSVFQEFGFLTERGFEPGHPFLRPSFRDNYKAIVGEISRVLRSEIARVAR